MIHASYETKPPPRGDKPASYDTRLYSYTRAVMRASYHTQPPPQENIIREVRFPGFPGALPAFRYVTRNSTSADSTWAVPVFGPFCDFVQISPKASRCGLWGSEPIHMTICIHSHLYRNFYFDLNLTSWRRSVSGSRSFGRPSG